MNILMEILGYGFVLTTSLSVFAKLLPNTKLYAWGLQLGQLITGFSSTHIPKTTYEKIEDFVQNSFGVFFGGVTDGLNSDDIKYKPKNAPKKDVKR
jgi:hypothetical protein